MEAGRPGGDPGSWVNRLEDQCRREAMEIRLRAGAEAEEASARALADADATVERRIARLRQLRSDLAAASETIESDMVRAATEIRRRGELTYPQES